MSQEGKDPTVALFVRIPTALKERIRWSARTRGATITEEVARLLDEQLKCDPVLRERAEHEATKTELRIYRGQLQLLEGYIERVVCSSDLDDAMAKIRDLRDRILKNRSDRQEQGQKLKEEFEQRRKEHEASRGNAERSKSNPLLHQLSPGFDPRQHGQLPGADRRRLNLLAILEKGNWPRGTKKKIAAALGWSQSQLSQLLSAPTAIGHRSINDLSARKIEAVLGLDRRALDRPEHDAGKVDLQRALDELAQIGKKIEKDLGIPRRKQQGI